MKKIRGLMAMLTVSALLLGCSNAPGEGDLKKVFDQKITAELNQLAELEKMTAGLLGRKASGLSGSPFELVNFHKIGCKETGEKSYTCDVEVEAKIMGETSKGVHQMEVLKGSEGWILRK